LNPIFILPLGVGDEKNYLRDPKIYTQTFFSILPRGILGFGRFGASSLATPKIFDDRQWLRSI